MFGWLLGGYNLLIVGVGMIVGAVAMYDWISLRIPWRFHNKIVSHSEVFTPKKESRVARRNDAPRLQLSMSKKRGLLDSQKEYADNDIENKKLAMRQKDVYSFGRRRLAKISAPRSDVDGPAAAEVNSKSNSEAKQETDSKDPDDGVDSNHDPIKNASSKADTSDDFDRMSSNRSISDESKFESSKSDKVDDRAPSLKPSLPAVDLAATACDPDAYVMEETIRKAQHDASALQRRTFEALCERLKLTSGETGGGRYDPENDEDPPLPRPHLSTHDETSVHVVQDVETLIEKLRANEREREDEIERRKQARLERARKKKEEKARKKLERERALRKKKEEEAKALLEKKKQDAMKKSQTRETKSGDGGSQSSIPAKHRESAFRDPAMATIRLMRILERVRLEFRKLVDTESERKKTKSWNKYPMYDHRTRQGVVEGVDREGVTYDKIFEGRDSSKCSRVRVFGPILHLINDNRDEVKISPKLGVALVNIRRLLEVARSIDLELYRVICHETTKLIFAEIHKPSGSGEKDMPMSWGVLCSFISVIFPDMYAFFFARLVRECPLFGMLSAADVNRCSRGMLQESVRTWSLKCDASGNGCRGEMRHVPSLTGKLDTYATKHDSARDHTLAEGNLSCFFAGLLIGVSYLKTDQSCIRHLRAVIPNFDDVHDSTISNGVSGDLRLRIFGKRSKEPIYLPYGLARAWQWVAFWTSMIADGQVKRVPHSVPNMLHSFLEITTPYLERKYGTHFRRLLATLKDGVERRNGANANALLEWLQKKVP